MIISASRRTDIPALFSDWFVNRLNAGYVKIINPWNRDQIRTLSIDKDSTAGIVFWTKDPRNMLDKLKLIDGYMIPYYFQFTLTPYDRRIEKNQRDKKDIARTLIKLCGMIGPDRVKWRYDPILFNGEIDTGYHRKWFEYYCDMFAGYQKSCTISFVDDYRGLDKAGIYEAGEESIKETAKYFANTAARYSILLDACSEKIDLEPYGISRSKCVDAARFGIRGMKDKHQREYCRCDKSVDIGMYQTCTMGCIYCYANKNHKKAAENYMRHDPNGEYIIRQGEE